MSLTSTSPVTRPTGPTHPTPTHPPRSQVTLLLPRTDPYSPDRDPATDPRPQPKPAWTRSRTDPHLPPIPPDPTNPAPGKPGGYHRLAQVAAGLIVASVIAVPGLLLLIRGMS